MADRGLADSQASVSSGRLERKVTLVTGAAGAGLGQALAERFCREGAHVVLTDSHARRAEEAAARLSDPCSREVLHFVLDVRKQPDIDACMAGILDKFERVDVLINNAGYNGTGNVWGNERRSVDALPGHQSHWNVPPVTRRTAGDDPPSHRRHPEHLVDLRMAVRPWRSGQAAYAAAKAGQLALTRAMAAETGKHGIGVNAIAAGLIYNEFLKRTYDQSWLDAKSAETLVGRIGRSDDVTAAAVFLASDEASFITGEVMCISGGWFMRP